MVEIKCLVGPPNQKPIKFRMKKPRDDWKLNLPILIKSIPTKFECLQKMADDQWALSLNGNIMDKFDPDKFGEIISQIPSKPIVTMEIIEATVL